MIRIHNYILIPLLLTGCFQHEPNPNINPETAVELPEHLQDLENLTVHPEDTAPAHSIEFERDRTFETGFQIDEDIETYIDDEELLRAAKSILDRKYTPAKDIVLNEYQEKRIEKAKESISRGEALSNEQADELVTKWLKG